MISFIPIIATILQALILGFGVKRIQSILSAPEKR
jgi:hypothetical protein